LISISDLIVAAVGIHKNTITCLQTFCVVELFLFLECLKKMTSIALRLLFYYNMVGVKGDPVNLVLVKIVVFETVLSLAKTDTILYYLF